MIDRGKRNLLGVLIDAVDYEAAVDRLLAAAREGRRQTCSALAVHGVMSAVLDPSLRYRINRLDLVVPDGQPVRWGVNWLYGVGLRDRVYGPELTLRVCRAAGERGLSLYLYGSRVEVLERLRANLEGRFPGLVVAGSEPSRFRRLSATEKGEVVRRIRASGAALTVVGLGCPRQEIWAHELGDELSMPVLAVGAAFDFHAGTLAQAPPRLQRLGLEWLYRWIREPRRLWARYLLLNPAYLLLLACQRLGLRRFSPHTAMPPKEELLPG
ncbi:MAG: WecB/TagA/CpsF family glycosyltransferase [Thermoanaerobaculia bacterium]|nr:WecB/TagA/CpsF family glycosyltransferase [Thermoanaerobaculia bacterium]